MNTADERRLNLWHEIIEREFLALFIAAWWHEATRGYRAFIVPEETVEWLRERAQNILIDPDTNYTRHRGNTTANYVLDRMMEAARTHERDRNIMYFPGTLLRPSEFVWTNGLRGEFDSAAVAGRQFARGNMGGGRILEMYVQRDEHGRALQINHNRPRPHLERDDERAPQRQRFNSPRNNDDYRPVPSSAPHPTSPVRVTYHADRGPFQRNLPVPELSRPIEAEAAPRHPALDLTPRQVQYRHNAPMEPGREEVYEG